MSARLTRQHNDANMMALGAGVVGEKLALEMVDLFLTTPFEGGRHARRVDKVMALEESSTFPQISIYWTSRTSPRQRVMCPWEGFFREK